MTSAALTKVVVLPGGLRGGLDALNSPQMPVVVQQVLMRHPPLRHSFEQFARLIAVLTAAAVPKDDLGWWDRAEAARVWLEFNDRRDRGAMH